VLARAALLALLSVAPLLHAEEALRITQLQRCGDLLQQDASQYCLRTRGLAEGELQVHLGEARLTAENVERDGQTLRLDLPKGPSAPLWLQQGERRSNPVWLSRGRSQVVAAGPDEVAKNMDGLTTYLDLVSLLIEEKHDGREEAERLAKRYGAQVVGGIPPLNVYQLRLPAKDLVQRDAWMR
jgi:hypothetical protein